MPDQTDELIQSSFADLRAHTLATVRPPGVDAARHTVRRRRATTPIATALTVLAVAGGTVSLGLRGPGNAEEHPTAAKAWTAGPVLGRGRAVIVIGKDRVYSQLGGVDDVRAEGRTAEHSAVAGDYTLRIACVGDGALDIRLTSTSPEVIEFSGGEVRCERDTEPAVSTLHFTMPSDGTWQIGVTGDEAAVGRASFAYAANLAPADMQALRNRAGAAVAAAGSGGVIHLGTAAVDAEVDKETDVAAGPFRLLMTCAGAGAVDVLIRITDPARPGVETPLATRTVACGESPAVRIGFTADESGRLRIQVNPDDEAIGQAAIAAAVQAVR